MVGQGRVTHLVAPHLHRVIHHLFLGARAVLLQHLAGVGIGKHRLDPRTDIPGIKRNRPRRRNRGQQRVADAMFGNFGAHIRIHRLHGARGQVALGVEQRKRALFARQLHGPQVRGAGDGVQPAFGLTRRFVGTIAQTDHQQRIGQPGDAKADAALGRRLAGLRLKRKARGIDHVVHHPHGSADQLDQLILVQRGGLAKRVRHQPRQVDRPEQARAIGRQGLFAAGVGGRNRLAVIQVVGRVDPVDENHARFGVIIGRAHDGVPQIARLHGLVDGAVELQIPRPVRLHRLHERIGHKDRDVEHAQPGGVGLGGDEILDIRVIATHRRHHRTPARACGHDRAAHRVPHIHERQRARSIRRHALDPCPLRPDGAEIVADAAALLHGQRRLFQHLENAAHAVGDRTHNKAVEQRDRARRARTCRDAARRQEPEILKGGVKPVFPVAWVVFDLGQVAGDAPPAVLDGDVDGRAIGLLEAILHVPDLFGNRRGKACHQGIPIGGRRFCGQPCRWSIYAN